jgi:D-glycero-D-manno-heptose 1,7-bisphosphate phosphatase
MRPAIFLDRDGTIIREAEYLADPAGVEILAGAAAGLRALRAAGFLLVVTSNQSGVARGYFDESTVARINQRLRELLSAGGADVDAIYYCPHHTKGTVPHYAVECQCRKPNPGMILSAQKDLDIDLAHSWVIGDKEIDIQFGKNLGLRTVLVLTGYGAKTQAEGFKPDQGPDIVSPDLTAAAQAIIRFAQDPPPIKRWGRHWGERRSPLRKPVS